MNYSNLIAVSAIVIGAAALTAQIPAADYRPVRSAHAEPFRDVQAMSGAMARIRELGRAGLKLGYSCRHVGEPLDKCMAEYDDIFDKAIAGEPL